MENEVKEVKAENNNSSQQKGKKDYFLPISLLIAAIIIAGAVIYSNGAKTTGGKNDNVVKSVEKELALSASDVVIGDEKAAVTLFEYSDYECPYCIKFNSETKPSIIDNYIKTAKAKTTFRALAYHQNSPFIMNAVACANDQGKYSEMHDFVFAKQAAGEKLDEAVLSAEAKTLNIDAAKFTSCVSGNQHQADVMAETKEYQEAGFQATPIMVIAKSSKLPVKFDANYLIEQMQTQSVIALGDGAVAVIGAQPFSVYQTEIDKLLSK